MSRKTPSPVARFKIIDDSNGKDADLATKLDTSYKFLIYLKDPSTLLIDERALKAIEFIKSHRDTKLNQSLFHQNIEIVHIYSNILHHYYNDFKAYITNYETLNVNGKPEGVERVYISQFLFIYHLAPILWNGTNKSASFRYKFHEANGTKALLTYFNDVEFIEKCIRFRYSVEKKEEPAPGLFVIRALIGTFNNLSKIADEIQKDLNDLNATSILAKLADTVKEHFSHRLSTYMAIANVMCDKEIESMPQTRQVIKDLIDLIQAGANQIAAKCASRNNVDIYGNIETVCVVSVHGSSYHLVELFEALYQIAVNDSIKLEIYDDYNIKDSILKIAVGGNNVEREYAIKLLWQLCFDERIVQKVSDDSGLLKMINEMGTEKSPINLKNYCEGVLWSIKKLQEKKSAAEKPSESLALESVHASMASQSSAKKSHIMISYNRESRELCVKIKTALEAAGYKIWIDIENIHGSSLEAMANAIEQSQCILICMTEKYKLSPNCRAEAEYAFRMNTPIIPLIMQKDYMPDGWLGIILGSKIFVHFMKYSFEVCMKKLFDEITPVIGSMAEPYAKIDSVTRTMAGKMSFEVDSRDDAGKWSQEQVRQWLQRVNFGQEFNKHVEQFDGRLLLQFYKVKQAAPEYFFTSLKNDFKLNLVQVVKLAADIDDLFKDHI